MGDAGQPLQKPLGNGRVFLEVTHVFGSEIRSRKRGSIVKEVAIRLAVRSMLCAA